VASISGYARVSASFQSAASPQGSVSIANALTFGTYSSLGTVSVYGLGLWDASSAGNLIVTATLQMEGWL
jgi:uncharacterized protein (DUF2344 family)